MSELSRADLALTDLLHACEFFDYDEAESLKVINQIKDWRIRRRAIKDEKEIIEAILNMTADELFSGKIETLISRVAGSRVYIPRMLPELFDRVG